MTTDTQKTVEVDLPVDEAYDLWTDFESFPKFMRNVDEVKVLGPGQLHWKASILGVEREWDASVTSQVEGQTIAWESTSGATNSGRVDFEPIGLDRTRIHLDLHFEPEGLMENVGDKLGLAGDGAEGDLLAFKKYAEELLEKSGRAGLVTPDAPVAYQDEDLDAPVTGEKVIHEGTIRDDSERRATPLAGPTATTPAPLI